MRCQPGTVAVARQESGLNVDILEIYTIRKAWMSGKEEMKSSKMVLVGG